MEGLDCYQLLGLTAQDAKDPEFDKILYKAYFAKAKKYHPDKNPDGSEMFALISKSLPTP